MPVAILLALFLQVTVRKAVNWRPSGEMFCGSSWGTWDVRI